MHGGPSPSFGKNLIVNGGAEDGPGSTNGDKPLEPIPGWSRSGVFQVVQYGASGGFADAKSPGPANRGKNYFVGGPSPEHDVSSASQRIDLSPFATAIAGGRVKFTFSAYIGGFEAQEDYGYVTASFLSKSGQPLKVAKLGPVTAAQRHGQTGLLARSTSSAVPLGASALVVRMTAVRKAGAYSDGSFDNLSLIFKR